MKEQTMRTTPMPMAAILSMLALAQATAAPIAATEPPDLPGSGGPVFTVDAGTNTVTGFVNGSPYGGDFQDMFSVFVPANIVVTSAWVTVTEFNNLGGTAGLGCFTGAGCFGSGMMSGLAAPASGSTVSFTATSPWQDDPQGGVNIGSFKFELTLVAGRATTSTVPEPASWALALAALGAAGMRRRR